MKADLTIKSFQWGAPETEAARHIRERVFIVEQAVPEDLEWDEDDAICIHALATVGGQPVATGRLLEKDGEGRIGRMAVMELYRGMGVGARILEHLIDEAEDLGITELVLSSQTYAIPFYARYGFIAEGEEYTDAGIPHRDMRRDSSAMLDQ
jgi:predicted GNAT family N-acyltransferase